LQLTSTLSRLHLGNVVGLSFKHIYSYHLTTRFGSQLIMFSPSKQVIDSSHLHRLSEHHSHVLNII